MNVKILIVEDESIIAEELKRIIEKIGYSVSGVVHRYEEAVEILMENKTDLVLLDIGLDYSENDGIDLATYINEKYSIPFIYITANADLATVERAKKTEPASYILKPFNSATIFTNIEIALHKWKAEKNKSITVTYGSKKVRVPYSEIMFLKSDNMYTEIHTDKNKMYAIRGTFKTILDKLPSENFLQVHRSYAVNLDFIHSYSSETMQVSDKTIPIGNSFKIDLLETLKKR